MSMKHNGLAKLTEECGELCQVAGKMLQYPELQVTFLKHPDGKSPRQSMIDEMGDVLAAVAFVCEKLKISAKKVHRRKRDKLDKFYKWDKEKDT